MSYDHFRSVYKPESSSPTYEYQRRPYYEAERTVKYEYAETQQRHERPPRSIEEPPAKKQRIDMTEEFNITVGPDKQFFAAPASLLTKSSRFFAVKYAEGPLDDRKIKVPFATPDSFTCYLQFIYTGDVVVVDSPASFATRESRAKYWKELVTGLVTAYTLGCKLWDARFRCAVIDCMVAEYARLDLLPTAEDVRRAYEATTAGSALRRAMVRMYVHGVGMTWLEEHGSLLPAAFLTDIIKVFANAYENGLNLCCPSRSPRCTFHEHDEIFPRCG